MKKLTLALYAASLTLVSNMSIAQGNYPTLWSSPQAAQPESVIEHKNSLFVSNINGAPLELNGLGYISKFAANGKLIADKWVSGLDAPKGLAASATTLYIADMQHLVTVDIVSGEVTAKIKQDTAKMLNDVTLSDSGEVFVSDFLGGVVYKLVDSSLVPYIKDPKLPYPNGLLWHQGRLLVGNWGLTINDDFTTQVPGSLYAYSPDTKTLELVSGGEELGNIDGIASHNNRLYVSDWINGKLFEIHQGKRRLIKQLETGLADIGISRDGTLYAPMMLNNRVDAYSIK